MGEQYAGAQHGTEGWARWAGRSPGRVGRGRGGLGEVQHPQEGLGQVTLRALRDWEVLPKEGMGQVLPEEGLGQVTPRALRAWEVLPQEGLGQVLPQEAWGK